MQFLNSKFFVRQVLVNIWICFSLQCAIQRSFQICVHCVIYIVFKNKYIVEEYVELLAVIFWIHLTCCNFLIQHIILFLYFNILTIFLHKLLSDFPLCYITQRSNLTAQYTEMLNTNLNMNNIDHQTIILFRFTIQTFIIDNLTKLLIPIYSCKLSFLSIPVSSFLSIPVSSLFPTDWSSASGFLPLHLSVLLLSVLKLVVALITSFQHDFVLQK
jgi:hypothetical protein